MDRLLQSPHYGERMALPWLDAARYADTNGYQVDHERFMWRWRDWVIDAFNKNMPFDQFTVEQLAGDLLPNPTLDQKIATGFNRNHRTNARRRHHPRGVRSPNTSSTASRRRRPCFSALTLGCARCHDHKYDPFTQKEFYQLFAYFNNVPEHGRSRRGNCSPYIKAPTPEQQVRAEESSTSASPRPRARFAKLEPRRGGGVGGLAAIARHRPGAQWAPARGLIAHYALDGAAARASGRGAVDAHGTAWTGNAAFGDGIVGGAAKFDGKSFIDAGDVGEFRDDEKFTLSAWIYPTAGTGRHRHPRSRRGRGRRDTRCSSRTARSTWASPMGGCSTQSAFETEKPIELNRWHHVLGVYDGSREARGLTLFVDGVPQATAAMVDILNDPPTVRDPLRIGGGGGPENRFSGLIDDVRVYKTCPDGRRGRHPGGDQTAERARHGPAG